MTRGQNKYIQNLENITEELNSKLKLNEEVSKALINTIKDSYDENDELEESIKDDGLLHPIILWKKDENKYTILSGNNRMRALKNLGYNALEKNMYIVKENLTYDEAKLIVVDANLVQRKNLLPSERAKAYKIQQEVITKNNTKRMGKFAFIFEKNDLNTSEQE